MELFYANLFESKDSELEDINLYKLLDKAKVNKVSDHDMGSLLDVDELQSIV